MATKSTSPKSSTESAVIIDGAIIDTPQTAPAITPELALAFLVSHYGVPSASIAERALKASLLASNANSTHGAMRAKLPVISELEKLGKANANTVTDSDSVKRDASSLSSDQRKEYNRLQKLIEAAKLLGILAPKAR